MNPLVQSLSRELASMPASDRERFFEERQIPPEIRAEVESVINLDSSSNDDLTEVMLKTPDGVVPSGTTSSSRSLHVGKKLGSYEITALLGKGGMGEVYRAHDWKLKRDVAIKIVPE